MPEQDPQSVCIQGLAIISGWPAWAIARMLTRYCRDEVADVPPDQRQPIEEAIEALRCAGEHWVASARGNATRRTAAIVLESNHDDELDSAAAAAMIGVGVRRVRQLAVAGHLPGRLKAGRCWSFDTDDVTAYRDTKTGGTK